MNQTSLPGDKSPWGSLARVAGAVIFLLLGCQSIQQPTEKGPLYTHRASMQITIGNRTFDGMAVSTLVPMDISIVSQAALDLLRITTCHRDFTVEKVDKGWFGGSGHKYVFKYIPTDTEKASVCPMYIQAISKDLVTDWGYIAFLTDEKLGAQMDCNGAGARFDGVSVCQTKAGLDQVIRFDRPVIFAADPACQITQRTPKEYVVRGSQGFCYAEFTDKTVWHRLILLGYDSVLVRGQ